MLWRKGGARGRRTDRQSLSRSLKEEEVRHANIGRVSPGEGTASTQVLRRCLLYGLCRRKGVPVRLEWGGDATTGVDTKASEGRIRRCTWAFIQVRGEGLGEEPRDLTGL